MQRTKAFFIGAAVLGGFMSVATVSAQEGVQPNPSSGSQMNQGGSQINPSGSQLNQGGSQINPGGSQMNTGSQMNRGSQMNTGSQLPSSATAGQLITASAKVQKVDLSKRELTLRSDDGRVFTVEVPENVTRLDNVKPGDRVDASFYESVAVQLQKPGQSPLTSKQTTMTTQQPGALPGGTSAQQITTTAKITKIDPSAGELTIQNSSGKMNTIKVDDPQMKSQLQSLKVGDQIRATYTEAMAAQITPRAM